METKFQTSFIPKANLDAPAVFQHKPVNFFSFIATIIFLISVLVAGSVYGWKILLRNQNVTLQKNLEANEKQFEPQTIANYARLNSRFDSAKKLLDAHVSVSAVFDILENKTLKTIRFKDFKYSFQNENSVSISMVGEARSYNSVAYQSQVFSSKENRALKNIVFSNLDLDQSGNVVFKFDARVEPKLISYQNNLNSYGDQTVDESATSDPTAEESASSTSNQTGDGFEPI